MGQHDQAVERYRQAIALFQRTGHSVGEMQTCDLLASAEANRGQLDAAEAWYRRSRELAEGMGNKQHLGRVAQNLGILYQTRAEREDNPETHAGLLRRAVASIEQSLAITLEQQDQVGAASSYFQLGVLHRRLGDLDRAEKHALQALKIREALDLPEVYTDYANLADIARARGDEAAAARWQEKYEAKVAEIQRLRRGDGAPAVPDEVLQALTTLAQAAYHARRGDAPLPPEAAEALAQLAGAPPPWPAVGAFIETVAAQKPVPPLPADAPPQVGQILAALAEATRPEDGPAP